MTAKEFLNRPNELLCRIECIEAAMENLRLNMLPRGISYDRDKVQTSPADKMPDFAAKISEYESERVKLLNEYENALDEVLSVIQRVTNASFQKVLIKWYISNKPLKVIVVEIREESADNCGFCERTIQNYHAAGLREVEKIINEMPGSEGKE